MIKTITEDRVYKIRVCDWFFISMHLREYDHFRQDVYVRMIQL